MEAFVRISEIGIQSPNGRVGHSMCGGKKSVAPPDRPFALAGQFINTLMEFAEWSTAEAAQSDLDKFKAFVNDLKVTPVSAVES